MAETPAHPAASWSCTSGEPAIRHVPFMQEDSFSPQSWRLPGCRPDGSGAPDPAIGRSCPSDVGAWLVAATTPDRGDVAAPLTTSSPHQDLLAGPIISATDQGGCWPGGASGAARGHDPILTHSHTIADPGFRILGHLAYARPPRGNLGDEPVRQVSPRRASASCRDVSAPPPPSAGSRSGRRSQLVAVHQKADLDTAR